MMQIGEAIAVVISVEKKDDCWYCDKEPTEASLKSKVVKSSNYRGGLNRVNKLSDLSWMDGKYGGMHAEAHHLIAGRSMLAITALHEYILEEKGRIREDIGYDLNHSNNLIWMPGRPVPQEKDKRIAVIKESYTQIHNSGHPDYRANIRELLSEIHAKIKREKTDEKCPLCEKEIKDKERPPYGLVGRLDALSIKLKSLLTGNPDRWLLDEGYYTSSRGVRASVKNWINDGDL